MSPCLSTAPSTFSIVSVLSPVFSGSGGRDVSSSALNQGVSSLSPSVASPVQAQVSSRPREQERPSKEVAPSREVHPSAFSHAACPSEDDRQLRLPAESITFANPEVLLFKRSRGRGEANKQDERVNRGGKEGEAGDCSASCPLVWHGSARLVSQPLSPLTPANDEAG
ncbi:hypothetical protein TGRUB_311460 [Toxoplasma gondii RUB]|uniref:Uncharacterized protein n=1 Tax=Toxoplasma gondii RUB TaxID=935652 RepID=A0A086MAJ6_TOXGO|nr:hypothetical protein TGRUB_311460 [Toxoplasma gondii RUB]